MGFKRIARKSYGLVVYVSKNKTKDYLKRNSLFAEKIAKEIRQTAFTVEEMEIDLSVKNINDSQLAMMFAVCHPCISTEAQVGLSLNLLCGFGVEEIADAFLTNKEVIYKRLNRAKEKLRAEKVKIGQPSLLEINERQQTVLTTLYLLFNEGYYSVSNNAILRKDLCVEAMRLNLMLVENELTNTPAANALLSLMCFHSSRFEARTDLNGEIILYEDQDGDLWNKELIVKGEFYLNRASTGELVSRYHLEAAIAYWHTQQQDTTEKWENILQLYNKLLQMEYSPVAALNRTYALSKANGKIEAIAEAKKLGLENDQLYHALLGKLYSGIENEKALMHFKLSHDLARSDTEKRTINNNINKLIAESKKG